MAEDSSVETPKRKRGRPPKPDSEKKTPKRKAESDSGSAPKRGRGRPKGSKNKRKKPVAKGTGKRGRPRKNPPPQEDASEESAEGAEESAE